MIGTKINGFAMEISPNQALDLWRRSVVRSVRNDSPDFS
ncbi:MAG: MarR family transcriptional regulator, partial [Alphaproteobacteria bacterium]|nr:MarR family transcriptional regulator [Alphaproteobacteria bacterium]